jgi:hypothetical protein
VRSALSFVFVLQSFCLLASAGGGSRLASPSVPATFTLKPGQTASIQGIDVTFRQVVSDSRCPINALCIWAGDATIAFSVRALGQDARHDLQLAEPAKRTVAVRQFILELQDLQPYPVAGQPPDADSYRATISHQVI